MRHRSKMNKNKSKRMFKRTARPIKKFNKGTDKGIKRGGYRL